MRFLLSIAAALAVATPSVAFQAAAPRATVDFPQGWRVSEREGLLSARHPADRARCNRDVVRIPAFDGKTQEELDAELARPWGAPEWAAFMGANPSRVELVGTEARPADEGVLRTGTLLLRAGASRATREDVYGYIGTRFAPGYVVIAACYAPVRHWDAMRAVLEATVRSLRVDQPPYRHPSM